MVVSSPLTEALLSLGAHGSELTLDRALSLMQGY